MFIQEAPGRAYYMSFVSDASTRVMSKLNPVHITFNVAMLKKNIGTYAYLEKDLVRIGKIFLKEQTKDPAYSKKLIQKWKPYKESFYALAEQLDQLEWKTLSRKDLANWFSRFSKAYLEEYALPLLTDPVGYYCEVEIKRILKEHLDRTNQSNKFNRYLVQLTQAESPSFMNQEQYELYQLVQQQLAGKTITNTLKEHAKQWFWIQNNYFRTIVLEPEDFMKRIKEHAKHPERVAAFLEQFPLQAEKARQEKQEALQQLGLAKQLSTLLDLLEQHTAWQDDRKQANLIAHHYLTLFIKAIANLTGVPLEDLYSYVEEDIKNLLDGEPLDQQTVQERKQLFAGVVTPEQARVLSFAESQQLEKELKEYFTQGVKDLFGTVACVGKAVGKAKIIWGPDDFGKMEQGGILVTSMTRPEFMPIMKKAGAIVTDEGGLTCHAAIVSRELNIPCIVGTKVATKLLKDNETIEVNANHGVVTRITN